MARQPCTPILLAFLLELAHTVAADHTSPLANAEAATLKLPATLRRAKILGDAQPDCIVERHHTSRLFVPSRSEQALADDYAARPFAYTVGRSLDEHRFSGKQREDGGAEHFICVVLLRRLHGNRRYRARHDGSRA